MQLRSEYIGIYWPELFLAFTGFGGFFLKDPRFLLGLALPILPFFEYGTLSCFILAYCLGFSFRKDYKINNQQALPFIALLLSPLAITLTFSLIQELDLYLLKTILFNSGPLGLLKYTKENYPVWYRALYHFASYLNFSLLILILPADTLLSKKFAKGIATGVVLSCLVGVAQLLELHPWFSVNREPFWLFVNRYEGTFTDPNALGVMAVLLLPYFYYQRAYGLIIWIAATCMACFSIFSESRTFWLGMAIWFLVVNLKNPKKLVLLATPSILLIPALNTYLQSLPFLSRFIRLLQTLNWNTFIDSLYSRLLMGEIALRMWKSAPVLGVGLERFYEAQESVAKAAGLDLGDWKDNANNFYLQVASEQGIYGLLMLLVLITYLYLTSRGQKIRVSGILLSILAVLFITGPHLFFEEVKYFVALLVSDLVLNSNSAKSFSLFFRRLLALTSILGILLLIIFPPKQRAMLGFWGKELDENGQMQAWTSSKARIKLCHVSNGQQLLFRTYQLPMGLSIVEGNSSKQISFVNTEWHAVDLLASEETSIDLVPSMVWSPSNGKPEGDQRWLGVMAKIPSYICQ